MGVLAPNAAADRIERNRKADVTLRVVAGDGKPLPRVALRVEQTSHAFRFGSNLFLWRDEPSDWQVAYRERFRELLNFATLGFYWWAYEPEQGKPRHAYVDAVLEWCDSAGVACKGHPLFWNWAAPRWLPDDHAEMRRLSDERVRDCVRRYAGRIEVWDVVNEATDPFRGRNFDNVLSDAWREAGRVEFTKHCFHVARAANPSATLLINDYRHDAEYERLIEALNDADDKPLYDVIGIQTHQHGGPIPPDRLWAVCERFARFGVPLHFTETTIVSGPRTDEAWKTTPDGEAAQEEAVAAFYTTLFSHPSVEAITWWDFSDRHAWQSAPAGFLREDMSPKPAYERLMRLIHGEWRTEADLRTGAQGTVGLHAFYGHYDATIRGDDGTTVTRSFSLRRDGPKTVEIRA
jgi:GH35 family endo-1,4-beta-xylanase